jgi:hypothetical protein
LSGLWALGFYGLIPEKVATFTSVTSRVPRRFENPLGMFEYRHVKQKAFFGYRAVEIMDRKVLLAEPEKALLDLWHLGKGRWTEQRMGSMRFQNQDIIDQARLMRYVAVFDSLRLQDAAQAWSELARIDREGTVEL